MKTGRGYPIQSTSLTVADIYAIKKYFEKKLKPKVDIKWELDDEEPEALKMFYKMNPTLYAPGRKSRNFS